MVILNEDELDVHPSNLVDQAIDVNSTERSEGGWMGRSIRNVAL